MFDKQCWLVLRRLYLLQEHPVYIGTVPIRSVQRRTFEIFHEDCNTRNIPRFVCNNYLFAMLLKVSHHNLLSEAVARLVRHWICDRLILSGESSNPLHD